VPISTDIRLRVMVRTHSKGEKSPSDETVQTVQKSLQETLYNVRKNRVGKGCGITEVARRISVRQSRLQILARITSHVVSFTEWKHKEEHSRKSSELGPPTPPPTPPLTHRRMPPTPLVLGWGYTLTCGRGGGS
jgi:hypothetical protein